MAAITISAAGGDWNNTATWVGGVVPTTSDSIIGDATSGQLTINVNATILFFDFTTYTQTLTINSNLALSTTGAGSTSTIGSGMTFNFLGTGSLQGRIQKGANAQTYTQIGTTEIPRLNIGNSVALTLGSNLHITNFTFNTSATVNGNNLYVYGNVDGSFNTFAGSTKLTLVGTGNLTILGGMTAHLIIDTSGTTTISAQGIAIGTSANNALNNAIIEHRQGTIVNPIMKGSLNRGTSVNLLYLNSGTTWDVAFINNAGGTNANLTFSGDCIFDDMTLFSTTSSSSSATQISFDGASIQINNFQTNTLFGTPTGYFTINDLILNLSPSQTINITNGFHSNGGFDLGSGTAFPNVEIRSSSAGVQAPLNINTYNQFVSFVKFTDIDCSGGNTLYGQTLTLSNTTNITQYTLPPSGGGGQTAYTFFS